MKSNRFFIIILILLLAGFFFSGKLSSFKDILNTITYPVARVFTLTSNKIADFFSAVRTINHLAKENADLRKEKLELEAEIVHLKEIRHENEILKKELGFFQIQKAYELIPSQIIGLSPSSFLQNFKIDKGSNDGVQKGRAVLSQGFLVGRISQVTSNTAEIEVINNSHSLIPVLLQESRGTGLLRGGLRGLIVEDVPIDSQIKVGEAVVTSGLGGELPVAIPIGWVEKVISNPSEIFQKLTVRSPLEFNKLEIVFVVK